MTDSPKTFPTIYWGDDQSTEVQFRPVVSPPSDRLVSACCVFAISDDKIVVSKPDRGWGLPGGHREVGETAEECVRREAIEEAAITLGDLELVGHWITRKRFDSEFNRRYPRLAYQLLYVAKVTGIQEFRPEFEVSERAFIAFDQMAELHHDFANFKEIFEYVLSLIASSFPRS